MSAPTITFVDAGQSSTDTGVDITAGSAISGYANADQTVVSGNMTVTTTVATAQTNKWGQNAGGSMATGTGLIAFTMSPASCQSLILFYSTGSSVSMSIVITISNGSTPYAVNAFTTKVLADFSILRFNANGIRVTRTNSGQTVCWVKLTFSSLISSGPLVITISNVNSSAIGLQAVSISSSPTPPLACFLGHSVLQLASGDFIDIASMHSGMQVRVQSADGTYFNEPVRVFRSAVLQTVLIVHVNANLCVTDDHLLSGAVCLCDLAPCETCADDGSVVCSVCRPFPTHVGNSYTARQLKRGHAHALYTRVYHIVPTTVARRECMLCTSSPDVLAEMYRSDASVLLETHWEEML